MKFLLRKQTKETKTRQKRFFAFMLSVLICCLPTATVLAENINIPGSTPPDFWGQQIGKTINSGEYIYGSGGNGYTITITYNSSKGTTVKDKAVEGADLNDGIKVDSLYGFDNWKVTDCNNDFQFTLQALNDNPQPVKEEKSEDTSERKHDDQTPASWEANPNEISSFYIKNGFIDNRTKLGKEEQGEACQYIFRSSFPAGNNYKEAFSLSMSYDGKHTTDLKDGTLLLYIPPNLQRSGRKFKMLAINKDGEVILFDNTSDNEGIFQTKLNVEGYAFCLIYTDEFILN